MEFGLSEPQRLLRDTIRSFLGQRMPIDLVRRSMQGKRDEGLTHDLAEQGLTAILVDEELGGAGLSLLDAVVAAQELGRSAAPYSFHTAAVAAPLLLAALAPTDETRLWLGETAAGQRLLTVILDPPAPAAGRLSGTARFVPDADQADARLVVCDQNVLLVPRDAGGTSTQSLETVDETRAVGHVTFSDLSVAEFTLGTISRQALGRVRWAALIALAADAYGAASRAVEMATAYAKERQQFDRVIGSFQAVKHLLAETVAELDPVQSLLWYAAHAWDRELEESAWLSPLLKAHASEVATQTVTNTTQVYGGMGFTHECDMHIFFKRVGYDRQMLGRPSELRREAAELRFGVAAAG